MQFFKRLAFSFTLLLLTGQVFAQDTPQQFSLTEAIQFALRQNVNVRNSQLDVRSSNARVGEIRSTGLPQLRATADLQYNAIIPVIFAPNIFEPGGDPNEFVAVQFAPRYGGNALLSLDQLLFDGSYFVGLKAASTYRELAQKNLQQTKTDVAEAVAKAYYAVLVNREQLELINANVTRLDTLLRETQLLFENGLAERIDVDRIEVQRNNLRTEQQNVARLMEVSYYLLKFQMGMKMNDPLVLTDQLADEDMSAQPVLAAEQFDYSRRIEYSTLQTQRKLADLDIQNNRMAFYPRLSAFGTYGYNTGTGEFSRLFTGSWFNQAVIGLRLNVPIFDGLGRNYRVQQAKIAHEQTGLGLEQLRNSIDLQIRQSSVTLTNSLESLANQRRNMELAEEVVRVARIKYQQGVGSNIEVINAETSFKEAQTNYYNALYDALVAKVDLEKATGNLPVD